MGDSLSLLSLESFHNYRTGCSTLRSLCSSHWKTSLFGTGMLSWYSHFQRPGNPNMAKSIKSCGHFRFERAIHSQHPVIFNALQYTVGFLTLGPMALAGCERSFIIGLYFILTGIERFTEDAYRGEIQTRFRKGLRENQWIALGSLLIGIALTMIPTSLPGNPAGTLESSVVCHNGGRWVLDSVCNEYGLSQINVALLPVKRVSDKIFILRGLV